MNWIVAVTGAFFSGYRRGIWKGCFLCSFTRMQRFGGCWVRYIRARGFFSVAGVIELRSGYPVMGYAVVNREHSWLQKGCITDVRCMQRTRGHCHRHVCR